MKVQVNFKQVNSKFDKERFEWFDGGEPDNSRYHFTESFELKNVKSKTFESSIKLNVHAKLQDESEKSIVINDVSVLKCLMIDGSTERFFVSKNLLRNNHETYDKKSDTVRFYFYLIDNQDFGRVDNVTLLSISSFTEDFLKQDIKELRTDYKSNAKMTLMSGTLAIKRSN